MAKGVTGLRNRVIRIGFDCKQLTRFGALPTSKTLKSEGIYKNTYVLKKTPILKIVNLRSSVSLDRLIL